MSRDTHRLDLRNAGGAAVEIVVYTNDGDRIDMRRLGPGDSTVVHRCLGEYAEARALEPDAVAEIAATASRCEPCAAEVWEAMPHAE